MDKPESTPTPQADLQSFVIELAGIYGLDEHFLRALPVPTLEMWMMLVRDEAKRHKSERETMEKFRKELCDLKFGARANSDAPPAGPPHGSTETEVYPDWGHPPDLLTICRNTLLAVQRELESPARNVHLGRNYGSSVDISVQTRQEVKSACDLLVAKKCTCGSHPLAPLYHRPDCPMAAPLAIDRTPQEEK